MTTSRIKNSLFAGISICIGIIASLLMAELGFRFYLFGPSLAYRDVRSLEKTPFSKENYNICFVGDSYTAGYPFPMDMSYPVLLKEGYIDPSKAAIMNFAIAGTTIYDQLGIIKEIVDLGPSLVVWGLSNNDICVDGKKIIDKQKLEIVKYDPFYKKSNQSNFFHSVYVLAHDCLVNRKMSGFSVIKEVLGNYSQLYSFLRPRMSEIPALKIFKAKDDKHLELNEIKPYALGYYDGGVDLEHVDDVLALVHDLLSNKGIELAVVFVPQESDINAVLFDDNIRRYHDKVDLYDRFMPRRRLENFCLKKGIRFIDPSVKMEEKLITGSSLFMKFDRHYNHIGNAYMAEILSNNDLFSRIGNEPT